MKRFILILALMMASLSAASGQDYKYYDDVIYGTDGTIVRGTIIEQIPGVSYKIATADGNVFVFDALKIERITKEAPIQNYYSDSHHRHDKYGNVVYKKSPLWAGVGSFLVTGLGQIINGQTRKGVLLMAGHAACFSVAYIAANYSGYSELGDSLVLLGLAGYAGTYIYSLIDAPLYASRWNDENGFAVGDHSWLKVSPTVGVSNTVATGCSTTLGLGATLTF